MADHAADMLEAAEAGAEDALAFAAAAITEVIRGVGVGVVQGDGEVDADYADPTKIHLFRTLNVSVRGGRTQQLKIGVNLQNANIIVTHYGPRWMGFGPRPVKRHLIGVKASTVAEGFADYWVRMARTV